jgi:type IV secretion system protein TrbL
MSAPAGSILPDSYFDGVSQLWGATAYAAASIVAAGVALTGWMNRNDPAWLLRLLLKVFLVGLATVFLREWLMRLGDVIFAFNKYFNVDPTAVDEKFIRFLSGAPASNPKVSAWDVIWNTGSVGTAIAYALLWLFGWLSWAAQFVVKLVGDILLTAGWALSPLFLALFLVRPMASVALKYVLGLVVLVCWPFGWVIAGVVTDAMLERAATASLIPVVVPGGFAIAPVLTVLLIGAWMLLTAFTAPYVLFRVLMSGANPAAAFAQSAGGALQAALVGGTGAAAAAVTGGAAVPAAVAAAALGTMAAGAESAARGGGFPQTTATAVGGMAGFYRGSFVRRQTAAMEGAAEAQKRRADASENFTAQFAEAARQSRERQTSFPNQPHHPDPNQAAIDIESHVKS